MTATSSAASSIDSRGGGFVKKVPKKFVPYPFEYHEEKTVRVTSLTNLGLGVCRVPVRQQQQQQQQDDDNDDHQQDWVIMVPNVIPGELIRVRVYRNYKTYSDGDVLEIVEPSQHRIQPECPLSEECGGCQYQHMDIGLQRKYKRLHVQEVLERIGHIENPDVRPTVGTDEVFHYRSKITPHYDRPQKVGNKENPSYEIGPIGFKKKTSRRLVDVPHCSIATPAINKRLQELRDEKRIEALEGRVRRPKRGATLLIRDVHNETDNSVVTDPKEFVTTQVGDLTFGFLAGNFFQNNPFMLPVMVDHVVAEAIKPAAIEGEPGLRKMTHLIDCYCGSGLFCLSSSSKFETCVGIELNDKAVLEAKSNAALNGIENCDFVAASAEAIFESDLPVLDMNQKPTFIRDFPRESTVVVVDPPRKGCSEEFLQQLYSYSPQRVVYMSCDPATQARDATGLLQNGYEISSVQPFDLFPQTRHIECLIVFERQSESAQDT